MFTTHIAKFNTNNFIIATIITTINIYSENINTLAWSLSESKHPQVQVFLIAKASGIFFVNWRIILQFNCFKIFLDALASLEFKLSVIYRFHMKTTFYFIPLSVWPSVPLSHCPLSLCPPVPLSLCPSVPLSLCPSVPLSPVPLSPCVPCVPSCLSDLSDLSDFSNLSDLSDLSDPLTLWPSDPLNLWPSELAHLRRLLTYYLFKLHYFYKNLILTKF